MRSLAPLLLVSSLTLPVAAQSAFQPGGSHSFHQIDTAPGPPTTSVAGDFDGDHLLDVVTRHGTWIVLAYGPPHYHAPVPFDLGALDIDLASGKGADGVDAFVCSRGSGPALVTYTPTEATTFSVTSLPVARPEWDGASTVRLSTDGGDVLYGVDATGTKLLVAEGLFGGTVDDHQPITADGDILDIVLLDWSGSADQEVAVMHSAGIDIYARDGSLVLGLDSPLDEAYGVAFRQNGLTKDRLAMVIGIPGSSDQSLHVLHDGWAEWPLQFGPAGTHAITAGDFDGDGDDDLLVTNRLQLAPADIAPFVLTNISDGNAPGPERPSFTLSSQYTLPLPMGVGMQAGPEQVSRPCVADFDRDGDVDLYYPITGLDGTRMLLNGDIDHTSMRYQATGGAAYFNYTDNQHSALTDAKLALNLNGPAQRDPNADHVYVVQRTSWFEQDGSDDITDPSQAEVILSSTALASSLLLPDVYDDVLIDLAGWDGPGLAYFELSAAVVDASGAISSLGPPSQIVISLFAHDSHVLQAALPHVLNLVIIETPEYDPDLPVGAQPGGSKGGGGIGPDVDPPPRMGGDGDGPPEPPPPPPPPPPGP